MHCPVCGQSQVNNEIRFCSRCGFPLAGVADLIANGGNLLSGAPSASAAKSDTPRKKGLRRGLMIFLLTFLVVPIVAIISMAVNIRPFVVAITAILFGVGGLLRMAYALLIQSNEPFEQTHASSSAKTFSEVNSFKNLPPQTSMPVTDYAAPNGGGRRRETNDLVPPSVVENTTKLLKKDE